MRLDFQIEKSKSKRLITNLPLSTCFVTVLRRIRAIVFHNFLNGGNKVIFFRLKLQEGNINQNYSPVFLNFSNFGGKCTVLREEWPSVGQNECSDGFDIQR